MPDPNAKSEYLGDGVHAQFDGFMIWLMVERCDAPFDENAKVRIERVALEPAVYEALCRFADKCWPAPQGEP